MQYISTRGGSSPRTFAEILLKSAAPDGGLYMPECWPLLSPADIEKFSGQEFHEVAFALLRHFVAGSIEDDILSKACRAAYSRFRDPDICPVRALDEATSLLELFHGPTFAFKDVAMQLLAELIEAELEGKDFETTIICATSGDTGAAAAGAFDNHNNLRVVTLFPKDKISPMQRRQMTAMNAKNIYPIAIEGNFDDAQAIVKDLFADKAFAARHHLTGVNSINWARIAAQVTYYFTAAVKLGAPEKTVSFCVPTGNFGDIFAGFVAIKMGLPIKRLIIATNQNDILYRALETGLYEVEAVEPSSSPSMDIQVSSNFERLLYEASNRDAAGVVAMMEALKANGKFQIPENILASMRAVFAAGRANEHEVSAKIRQHFLTHGEAIDPHTAVGLVVAEKCAKEDEHIVVLSTAHPAKFAESVEAAVGQAVTLPEAFDILLRRPETFITLPTQTASIKDYLNSHLPSARPRAT